MKKILLPIMCGALCLTLVGCGNNNDAQAIRNLNNQLSRVSEIVSSTSTSEMCEVCPSSSLSYTDTQSSIPKLKASSYQNMLDEEELRHDVLDLSASLKANCYNKYKLGRYKAESLNQLSGNLSKYVSYLNKTKSDVKNSVSKIKRSSNYNSLNSELVKSGYNELNNSQNERIMYLNNLYNTMAEIESLLNESVDTNTTPTKNDKNMSYQPNYPNYNVQDNDCKNCDEQQNNSKEYLNQTNNIQNANYYPYNNQYNNYNGYNNYYYRRNNRFNPNRNTDTFYPRNKNIDTYRGNPSYYNGIYNGYNPYVNPNMLNNVEKIDEENQEKKDLGENKDKEFKEEIIIKTDDYKIIKKVAK